MTAKEEALEAIKSLPDDVKLEQIIKILRFRREQRRLGKGTPPLEGPARKRFLEAIGEGLTDAKAGRLIEHDDLKRELGRDQEPEE